MTVTTRLTSAVFSRVFRASKDVMREVGPQLNSAVRSVSKIGPRKLMEFVAALPIFVLFVRQLLRQRGQVHAQKQLFIIGAAAALSSLGLVVLGGLLSSLPVQLLLLVTHPFIGLPLLVSGGLVIAAIMVVLVWLIIYVLNLALEGDPEYQRIRDEFLPSTTQAILADVQAEIEKSGSDLEALRAIVEDRLKARGTKADTARLEKELKRLEKRFRSKTSTRLAEAAQQAEADALSRR